MSPSYTLEEWMRGVPPPTQTYVYGVGVNRKEKLIPFVIRSGSEIPCEVWHVLEKYETTDIKEAMRLRNKLLQKYKGAREAAALKTPEDLERTAKEELRRQELGRVAAHSDGISVHLAILLDPSPQSFALFLTSRPGWARKFRLITQDERDLCGLKTNNKVTFLAPVLRPRVEFSLTPRQFPESRIVELLEEFDKDEAS